MFKKKEEINDLNDISLVNPDEEKQPTFKVLLEIFSESMSYLLYFSIFLISDNVSLIFLGSSNNQSNNFSESQSAYSNTIYFYNSIILIYTLCLLIGNGLIKILDSSNKTKRLYFEVICLLILLITIFYIPTTLCLYFFISKIPWIKFLVYSPIYVYLKLSVLLHIKLLTIKKLISLKNIVLVIMIILHIFLLYVFIKKYNFQLEGVIYSLTLTYFFSFLFTIGCLKMETRIFDEKDENDNEKSLISIYFSNLKAAFKSLFYSSFQNQRQSKSDSKVKYNILFNMKKAYSDHSITEPLINSHSQAMNNDDCSVPKPQFNILNFIRMIYIVFRISLLYIFKYIGFVFYICYLIKYRSEVESYSNIVSFNIILLIFLICFSFSSTLTDYISVQSFSHSHSMKIRYTYISCCFIGIISIFLTILLKMTSISIINFYTFNFSHADQEEIFSISYSILSSYSNFLILHYISIMLEGYIVNSSENILISYLINGIYSVIISPFSIFIIHYFSFSGYFFWMVTFIYNSFAVLVYLIYVILMKK